MDDCACGADDVALSGGRSKKYVFGCSLTHFDDPVLFNTTADKFFRNPWLKKDRIQDFLKSYEKLKAAEKNQALPRVAAPAAHLPPNRKGDSRNFTGPPRFISAERLFYTGESNPISRSASTTQESIGSVVVWSALAAFGGAAIYFLFAAVTGRAEFQSCHSCSLFS